MKKKDELPLPLPWRLHGGLKALVWVVLACCSPVLVPLICLSLPFIFIVFLCIRFDHNYGDDLIETVEEEEEEPRKEEVDARALLHGYLEDQLSLVVGSITTITGGDRSNQKGKMKRKQREERKSDGGKGRGSRRGKR
ncbi:uncharacterized protein A4U43_C06F7370 [Asparagus officinalis]|uniref:Uncharacterized protein n=1 Tax=Asparagus officinalis TaxID=4686 RepID=A0A5P1EK95_ASPOF|nr:uncharacterized protein A4U43_C06F7370 [Asparagus officinalis]